MFVKDEVGTSTTNMYSDLEERISVAVSSTPPQTERGVATRATKLALECFAGDRVAGLQTANVPSRCSSVPKSLKEHTLKASIE